MSDRWQDDEARARRINGRLREVRDARIALDAADAIASSTELEPWSLRRAQNIAVGKRKGLDAAIGMALFDPAEVPVDDLAAAAGEDVAYVERVRARLNVRY